MGVTNYLLTGMILQVVAEWEENGEWLIESTQWSRCSKGMMFSKFRLKLVGDIPVIPKVINLMALNRKDHEILVGICN